MSRKRANKSLEMSAMQNEGFMVKYWHQWRSLYMFTPCSLPTEKCWLAKRAVPYAAWWRQRRWAERWSETSRQQLRVRRRQLETKCGLYCTIQRVIIVIITSFIVQKNNSHYKPQVDTAGWTRKHKTVSDQQTQNRRRCTCSVDHQTQRGGDFGRGNSCCLWIWTTKQ